jgi:hypothetical protein
MAAVNRMAVHRKALAADVKDAGLLLHSIWHTDLLAMI